MATRHCPKCESGDVKVASYMGVECVVCNTCGFDERDALEETPQGRTSQKAKGQYSKYKMGGSKRTR